MTSTAPSDPPLWTLEHGWCAAALGMHQGGFLGPKSWWPRVIAVLPTPSGPEPWSDQAVTAHALAAHRALLVGRKGLATKDRCWVGTKPALSVVARGAGPGGASLEGDEIDGSTFVLVAYPPVEAPLYEQLLAIGMPEQVLGLVALVPSVLTQALVRTGGDQELTATIVSPAGDAFPDVDGTAMLGGWAISRRAGHAMLAARVERVGSSWSAQEGFIDLDSRTLREGEAPMGFTPGAHMAPPAVLEELCGTPAAGDAEDELLAAARFSVAQMLGRLALFYAVRAVAGEGPVSDLEVMVAPGYGQDLVDGGWAGVLADQGGPRQLRDLLTVDEARFLPVALLPELAGARTPRQAQMWSELDVLVRRSPAQVQAWASGVRDLVRQCFAAHPHWAES